MPAPDMSGGGCVDLASSTAQAPTPQEVDRLLKGRLFWKKGVGEITLDLYGKTGARA